MANKRQYMTLQDGIDYAQGHNIKLTKPTVVKYLKKYKLGHQIGGKGGPYYLRKEAWKDFINGSYNLETTNKKSEEKKETRKEEGQQVIP